MRWRVVCAFEVAIESRSPSSALSSVLLPTFGAPTIETKPARWFRAQSAMELVRTESIGR
jgi:hypothetical protein